jgi:hypothetical protein
MREQFDEEGTAALELPFAGKRFRVSIKNPDRLECGVYAIQTAAVDGQPLVLSYGKCRVQAGDTGTATGCVEKAEGTGAAGVSEKTDDMGTTGNAGSQNRADTATVLLARADIAQLSDEVHEIEIWLGKGEEGQR